jgi:hypothetical protein
MAEEMNKHLFGGEVFQIPYSMPKFVAAASIYAPAILVATGQGEGAGDKHAMLVFNVCVPVCVLYL